MIQAEQSGRCIKVNKAISDIMGYSKQELLSMKIANMTFQDDIEQSRTLICQLWVGEIESIAFEKRYIHKDGNVI
jgi:PAS domain S-box-containing protein